MLSWRPCWLLSRVSAVEILNCSEPRGSKRKSKQAQALLREYHRPHSGQRERISCLLRHNCKEYNVKSRLTFYFRCSFRAKSSMRGIGSYCCRWYLFLKTPQVDSYQGMVHGTEDCCIWAHNSKCDIRPSLASTLAATVVASRSTREQSMTQLSLSPRRKMED
jgi:hypothetical protein